MDTKLSDFQEKINEAQAPLPLFTCLHVKPDVSELKFAGLCLYLHYFNHIFSYLFIEQSRVWTIALFICIHSLHISVCM